MSAPTQPAQVVRIIDGDTFAYGGETVRIENIDAPEKSPRALCLAEARLAVIAEKELGEVMGSEWGASPVIERTGTDRYGRVLAKVRLASGDDVGEAMIAAGLAEPWTGRRADWCGQPR